MNSMDLFEPEGSLLTCLSYGAGQNSEVLLEKYINDPGFRALYAPNDFLVIMADTGNEFPSTYEHVERTKKRCIDHGIEFVFLTQDMGFHSDSWKTLKHFYKEKSAIGSKAFPKTCSDNLKIKPIYRFLESWLADRYGVQNNKKRGIREFAARFGKIKMLIGLAAGEEKRVRDASEHPNKWYRESIDTIYPLITLDMDRAGCQAYIAACGQIVPPPSNCICCPYLSLEELEYLRRFHLEDLKEWVQMEDAKLSRFRDKETTVVISSTGKEKICNKNYGVFGVKPLPVMIEKAKEKFSSWSDERINEYKFSHGHCVATVY